MKFNKFINECREKDVLKNLSIYIVSSWVLLQVVALISEPLGFSNSTVAYLLLVLLICFPLYVYWVWKFQLAGSIERKPVLDKTGVPIPGKFAKSSFQKIYFSFLTAISVIAFSLVLYIVKKNLLKDTDFIDIKAGEKMAVIKFDNNTMDEKYDIAGKMAVDWIIHGITQNKLGQVISPEIIDDYSKILKASIVPSPKNNFVTDYLKPSKIIEGEFFLKNGRLLFQCSIRDGNMDKTLIAFKAVECNPDAPLDCIEALTERILGYLVTEDKKILNLQDTPPSFEAYQYLIKAKNLSENNNYEEHLKLLDLAIAADSTFFEPKVYKFMYYYNTEQYRVADSLLQKLTIKAGTYERQQILLNLYKGLLEGNYKMAYDYQQKEYNLTPFHMGTNSSMMTLSLQLVNRPQAVDSIYREIDMKGIELQSCSTCTERFKIMALADIELHRYDEAIALLQTFANFKGYGVLKKVLLRAYIRSGKYEAAEQLLSNVTLTNASEWPDIYLFAAKEFLIVGNKAMEATYLDAIVDAVKDDGAHADKERRNILAESFFLKENYGSAQVLLEQMVQDDSASMGQKALLAIVYQKNGLPSKADALVGELNNQRSEYQFGSAHYALAQYYAAESDDTNTFKYLLMALAEGHWYETSSFQNDYFFRSYVGKDEFKQILNFWH